MSNILILFLLSCVTGAAQAGHFLFWAPFACEADYILMRDIGQELAKRGHEATLVGGYKYSTKNEEGIKEIVINSTFDKMIDAILGQLQLIGQLWNVEKLIEIDKMENIEGIEVETESKKFNEP